MKKILLGIVAMLASALICGAATAYHNDLRAPVYPLVTVDPYFSVWSFADAANADMTRHWSGRKQPLLAAVRVDNVIRPFPEESAGRSALLQAGDCRIRQCGCPDRCQCIAYKYGIYF